MPNRLIAFIFFLYLLAHPLNAQDSGIIYGEDFSFHIEAPEGWVWDSETYQHYGIQGLFYPENITFQPTDIHIYINPVSKQHIYINPVSKQHCENITLEEFIEQDIARYKDYNPNIVIEHFGYYRFKPDTILLYRLDDDQNSYYQIIGYRDENSVFIIFVLSCPSPESRTEKEDRLYDLMDSYQFLGKEIAGNNN